MKFISSRQMSRCHVKMPDEIKAASQEFFITDLLEHFCKQGQLRHCIFKIELEIGRKGFLITVLSKEVF